MPVITLLTDFGSADYFVPALKGVILTINPQAQLIDLTHEIAPQDIASGAFTLGACYREFPPGTIHLAVVDPGVGSARRPLVVAAGGHLFIGPDNGLFSYVYAREAGARVFDATSAGRSREPVSATFHGRDIFAPLAARLAAGLSPDSVGPETADYVRFDIPRPEVLPAGAIAGEILHIDRFGNLITNLTARELRLSDVSASTRLYLGEIAVSHFRSHFEAGAEAGQIFAYPGSAGYWEVGLWRASAAAHLGIGRGAKVRLER